MSEFEGTEKLTSKELFEKILREYSIRPSDRIDNQKLNEKQHKVRIVRVRVRGKEVILAHIIGVSETSVYRNLGLHIGVHEGEDHTGDSIGILRMTPPEGIVIAADIAVKSGSVDIGFMDRFSGALIITGPLVEVRTAIIEAVEFFRNELHFKVCKVSER